MIQPVIDPADISEINRLISNYFIRYPFNPDGTRRQQTGFTPQEGETLVSVVLSEPGRRGYAVAKPEKP